MNKGVVDVADRGFGPDWSAAWRRGSPEVLQEWLQFALDCCDAADAIALSGFRRDMHVSMKPDRTLVTDADQAIERLIRERVSDRYPDHGVLGEEYGESQAGASVRWHLDPIDGTHNFIRGVPIFGTLLAVERDGELQVGVMSAPAMRERWYASRGAGAWSVGAVGFDAPRRLSVSGVAGLDDAQLIYGSATEIETSGRAPGFSRLLRSVWRDRGFGDFWGYALVAEGAADGMVEVGVYPWDLAAPQVIIEEAGGRVTDFSGARRIDGRELLASNGLLHDELLVRLRSD